MYIIHDRLGKPLIWCNSEIRIEILECYGGDHEVCCLMGCDTVTSGKHTAIFGGSCSVHMGRRLRYCDLPNSPYAYTIQHGVTSGKKQLCSQFSGKYVQRCQFERFESDIVALKKSLAFFVAWNFHGRVKCRTAILENFNIPLFVNPLQLFFSGLNYCLQLHILVADVINCYQILVRPAVTGHCSSWEVTH